MKSKIAVIGAGGHAKVVLDMVKAQGIYLAEICLDDTKSGNFEGLPILPIQEGLKNFEKGIVAIGDNFTRSTIANKILALSPKFEFVSVVHPTATISPSVEIEPGSVFMPGSVVNASSRVGKHVIVNTNASVDHDCQLGNFCSIAPGSTLGGNVKIGVASAIGLGANIIHGISIGANSVIGAGSLVLKDFGDSKVIFGCPAKAIRTRSAEEPYLKPR